MFRDFQLRRASSALAALAWSSLVGCGAPPGSLIINGVPDDHTNVVRVSWGDGGKSSGSTCSGTYVGDGRIVTARHCIPTAADDIVIVTFVDYRDSHGVGTRLETGSYGWAPPDDTGDGVARVLVDDHEIPSGITGMPLLPVGGPSFGGTDVFTAIGFGGTSAPTADDPLGTGYDTRHKGVVTLISLSGDTAQVSVGRDSAAPCNGDSGGPLVVTRGNIDYLVGVLSMGDCMTEMQYIRADIPPNSTFIDSPATPPPGGGHDGDGPCAAGSPSGFAAIALGLVLVLRPRRTRRVQAGLARMRVAMRCRRFFEWHVKCCRTLRAHTPFPGATRPPPARGRREDRPC